MIPIAIWLGKLGASGYFFYRLKTKTTCRGGNGFGAGLFLALFLADLGKFFAPLLSQWWM